MPRNRLVTLHRFDGKEIVLNFDHVIHLDRVFAPDGVTAIGTRIVMAGDETPQVTESLEAVLDLAERA